MNDGVFCFLKQLIVLHDISGGIVMGNIISLTYRGKEKMKFEGLIKDLKEFKQKNIEYTFEQIREVANKILSEADYYSNRGATPIVKIAKDFNFKTFKQTLPTKLSGDIYINGDTFEKYGHSRVILVNKTEQLFHQRFVVAHELAHYLFEYLGDPLYNDLNIKFSDTYFRDQHETIQEKRANYFAAEILMPSKLFIKQYRLAEDLDEGTLFTYMYLSKFFETSVDSIQRRIKEVLS